MPNWCENRVSVEASTKDLLQYLVGKTVSREEPIQFQKIAPMPSVLLREAPPLGDSPVKQLRRWLYGENAIRYPDPTFAAFDSQYIQDQPPEPSEIAHLRGLERPPARPTRYDLAMYARKWCPGALSVARRQQRYQTKYGYSDWYQWRLANWGVKWEQRTYVVDWPSESAFTVQFDTAWEPPRPIAERVREMAEDLEAEAGPGHWITIEWEYHEDGMGLHGHL